MAHSWWQKKRAQKWERSSGAKVQSSWFVDASCLPLTVYTDSASPLEASLVQATLNEIAPVEQQLLGGRAYDRDLLDSTPAAQGIEMIAAPHRCNRKRKATQDGRALRRYRRRWKIGRFFACLNAFNRTMARWDRFHERFTSFVHLAFSMFLPRRLIREL